MGPLTTPSKILSSREESSPDGRQVGGSLAVEIRPVAVRVEQHPMDARRAGPEDVDRVEVTDVERRALSRRLPRVVRLRVVEGVRPDTHPVALRILAHVDEAGTTRKADEARVEPDPAALLLVDLGEVRIADRGEEARAEPRRAT